MADDYFDRSLAWSPDQGLVPHAVATVYALTDTELSQPLELTDLTDVPMSALEADAYGVYPPFKVVSGETDVIAVSGDLVTAVTSRLGMKGEPGDPGPEGAGVPPLNTGSPGMVATHVGDGVAWASSPAGIVNAPSTWPSEFPASPHSHPASQISNSTTVGRALLTAADAQAARAAIGAGTGNGTSDLTLGTASTQAAPGNHTHGATSLSFTPTGGITATNVQDAIVQAAATGSGGSGTSSVYVWRYASGAYPTLPASKPAGVDVVQAYGPVAPTVVPSWVGNGSGQALGRYEYAALT